MASLGAVMIRIKPADWHVEWGYDPHFCCTFLPSPPQPFNCRFPLSWQRLAACCAFSVTCSLHKASALCSCLPGAPSTFAALILAQTCCPVTPCTPPALPPPLCLPILPAPLLLSPAVIQMPCLCFLRAP